MLPQLVRSTELDLERVIDKYGSVLFRICFVILCNEKDAEDIVQDTFITYLTKSPTFHDQEHEKAWLITVATNRCKNLRRFYFKRKHMDISELQLYCNDEENSWVLDDIMKMPDKHKTV